MILFLEVLAAVMGTIRASALIALAALFLAHTFGCY